MIQPWDWLARWQAALTAPPEDWKKGWLAYAQHRERESGADGNRDISRRIAGEALDDEAQAYELRHPEDPRIDQELAHTLLRDAMRHVRPRPIPLRPDRECAWRAVERASRTRGVPLRWSPMRDEMQRQNERFEHGIFVKRAGGILQNFGRIFYGAVGLHGAHADLVVVQDNGGILLVEAMYIVLNNSQWRSKRNLAMAVAEHNLGFLFVGTAPPWVPTREGDERAVWTPAGARIVYDSFDEPATDEAPSDPRVNYMADPEELEGDKLRIEGFLAPPP